MVIHKSLHLSGVKGAKKHVREILLPLYLVFSGYSYGKISVGYIILAVWILISIQRHRNMAAPASLRRFIWYVVLLDVIFRPILIYLNESSISSTYMINTLFTLLYLLVLFFSSVEIDEDYLYKVWKIIGIAAIIGLLYQSVLVYGLGRTVTPIRLLPVFDRSSVWYTHVLRRPMSFFTEPASYVTYMLPLLYMSLKRNRIMISVVITLTFFLSTSTNGIVLAAILWCAYLILSDMKSNRKILLLFVMIALTTCILKLPVFEFARNKALSSSSLDDGSSMIRLVLGFKLYNCLDILQKIFGLQYSTLFSFLSSNSVDIGSYYNRYVYGSGGTIFTNGISSFLIWYGVVGTFLLVSFFVSMIRKSKKTAPFIIMMIVAMFAQGIFMNAHFLCYMALILMLVQTDVKKREREKLNLEIHTNDDKQLT